MLASEHGHTGALSTPAPAPWIMIRIVPHVTLGDPERKNGKNVLCPPQLPPRGGLWNGAAYGARVSSAADRRLMRGHPDICH